MRTYVYNGVTYVEVDRKAEVGDKVVSNEQIGQDRVYEVYSAYSQTGRGVLAKYSRGHTSLTKYRVLEPLEEPTVDTSQASEQVIDMLANLARRVTQLEQQLAATQRNLETFAEQTEDNSEDIRTLDERTQVINTVMKFYKEVLQ